MSNEIVDYDAILAKQAAQLSDRISKPSGDKIQITQSKKFKMPDGLQKDGPIEAVIVDFVSVNMYYSQPYKRDEIVAPDCYAIGEKPAEMVPSPRARNRQSTTCASCQHNQFGSGTSGSGKACKNVRRLAVLPPDALPDTPINIMDVSPTALKAFDAYVGAIAANFNAPPVKVVTTIAFDAKVDYPSLRFGNPKPLTGDQLGTMVGRMEEARKRLMVEPDYPEATAAPTKDAATLSRSSARVR